jgi:hypothetical protein
MTLMRRSIFVLMAMLAASATAGAQQRARDSAAVATAYRPPPGMCRVWLDGVKPADQPAPTDCATAVRNRPANGRVIFGDRVAEGSRVAHAPACTAGDSTCAPAPDCSKVKTLAGCATSWDKGAILKGLVKPKKP